MKLEEGQFRWKATDLSDFSACRHKTVLEREHALGRRTRPERADPARQLLQDRGREHEARFLKVLEGRHGAPAHRVPVAPPRTANDWKQATELTAAAMRAGHLVIYQAPLALGPWSGVADFLVRRDHGPDELACDLGAFHYEVVDTKLAHEARGSAVLQLCVYSEAVGALQGRVPERFFVAGRQRAARPGLSAEPHEQEFRTADFFAYFRLIRARFAQFAQALDGEEPYPEPVEHCDACAWWEHCEKRRVANDHLSLVAGMARSHRRLLSDAGIATLTALGELTPDAQRPKKLPLDTFSRLRHQARLQLEARSTGPRFELLPLEAGRGLGRLPEPARGDVFFDIEADRYAPDGMFHYLLGWVVVDAEGKSTYEGLWARTRTEEQANFERFVDWVTERRRTHPGLRIYHFAPFEKTALGEMSLRFLSREAEVDALLRDQVLVDLLPVVKQGLRAGIDSYSIKELERFYGYARGTEPRIAARDRRLFELHREDDGPVEPPDVVPTITNYNREDCESTYFLREFLEQQRASWLAKGADVPRPVPPEPTDLKKQKEWQLRVEDLRRRLLGPIPEDLEQRPPAEQAGFRARKLLADVLDWHWREAKPEMWEYFRQRELDPEQLLEEPSPIGNLGEEIDLGKDPAPRKRVHRYRYAFLPQEYAVREGDDVVCPLTRDTGGQPVRYGEVVEVDRERNTITVERTPKEGMAPPLAFIKDLNLPRIDALQDALAEVAEALSADFGLPEAHSQRHWDSAFADGEVAFSAARALLAADVPRLAAGVPLKKAGETSAEALKRIAPHLAGTVLAVQGPPGTGKSHAASRMIIELVRQGKTVGICAQGHKVIENLLGKVFEAAVEARVAGESVEVFSVQRPKAGAPGLAHPNNRVLSKKKEDVASVLASGDVQVVAGTAWLFTDPSLRSKLDVLVIDEAGQFSLANALAASVVADSLVLVGDPQQLAQPSQASHPEGASASALEHLIGAEGIISKGRGLFLERTWRLPPSISAFTSEYYYGGILHSHPDCGQQRLDVSGVGKRFAGSGLVFEDVEDTGNVNHSADEAARVVQIARDLLDARAAATWTNREGTTAALEAKHVMVVAPYNAQVNLIRQQLDAAQLSAVRVGTVDKFQGQEAPVVIYSMTTSHPEDAPRGFEFLFSPNRFNVATSRAQAVAIIVASPRLLEADCKTPQQMSLVNGLCGAVEAAGKRGTGA